MGGEVLSGAAVSPLGIGVRQLQRHHRGLEQGVGLDLGAGLGGEGRKVSRLTLTQRKVGFGACHAVIVVGAEDEAQGPPRGGGRIAHQADGGGFVLDQLEPPFGHGLDIGADRLRQRHVELDQPFGAALLGLDGLEVGPVVVARGQAHGLALRRMGADDQLAPLGHGQSAEAL